MGDRSKDQTAIHIRGDHVYVEATVGPDGLKDLIHKLTVIEPLLRSENPRPTRTEGE